MGETGSQHRRCRICIKFYSETLKEEDHLEDTGVDGRIILKSKNMAVGGEFDWLG
jgi:hypothetical protein